jgi:hypothetical protein
LVGKGATIDGMVCRSSAPVVSAAHVELFAEDHVVVIPAGVGVAPPLRRAGAYVRGGSCVYPLHTLEPTGLVLLGAGPTRTLGEFFTLWGQPFGPGVLAGFSAPRDGHVAVYTDGVLWRGDPATAPLAPHSQVTIEVGPRVPPHAHYLFPAVSLVQ